MQAAGNEIAQYGRAAFQVQRAEGLRQTVMTAGIGNEGVLVGPMFEQVADRRRVDIWQIAGNHEPVGVRVLVHCREYAGDRPDFFVMVNDLGELAALGFVALLGAG